MYGCFSKLHVNDVIHIHMYMNVTRGLRAAAAADDDAHDNTLVTGSSHDACT